MFLLLIIAISCISYEFVNSEFVLYIKKWLGLTETSKVMINAVMLSSFNCYKRNLGSTLAFILLPIIVPLIVSCLCYRLLFKIINCIFCLSFWVALFAFFTVFNQPLLVALAYAGTSLLVVALYNLIRTRTI